MGPVASLVRRHVLLGADEQRWFWQLKGYGARHAAAVEREAAVMEHSSVIRAQLQLLFPRDPDQAWLWMTRPQPRLGGARPMDLMLGGFEGLLSVRRHLDW